MAPMRLMRRSRSRRWPSAAGAGSSTSPPPPASGRRRRWASTRSRRPAELSLSRLYADRCAGSGVLVNAICPGPVKSEMWMAPGGLLDQSVACSGHADRDEAPRGRRLLAADRPPRRGRGDRLGDRLPLLRARLLRARVGLERRRGHRPGDHLSAPGPRRRRPRAGLPRPGRGGEPACPRQRERRGPRAAVRLARAARADLHRASPRPAPPRRRDLVPRRARRARRDARRMRAPRGAGGDRPRSGCRRGRRSPAADVDRRHLLQGPAGRRPRSRRGSPTPSAPTRSSG